MRTIYLQVENSSGHFFEFSKEEKEGFVKHEYTNKQNVTKVSWRKYYEYGIFGTLKNITTKDSKIGTQISVCMDDVEGNRYFIQIPLQDSKSNITSFATSLISYMKSLKEGKDYRFQAYVLESEDKKGKTRKNYGVTFRYARLTDNAVDNKNTPKKLTFPRTNKDGKTIEKGDIPAIEWEDGVGDKPVANKSKQNKFLWSHFKENVLGDPNLRGVGYTQNTFDSTSEEEAKPEGGSKKKGKKKKKKNKDSKSKKNVVAGVDDEEEDDDLPF